MTGEFSLFFPPIESFTGNSGEYSTEIPPIEGNCCKTGEFQSKITPLGGQGKHVRVAQYASDHSHLYKSLNLVPERNDS